ncbi:hypothetical protein BDZ97DRAFT_1756322 [Flammula alnicola]|nr:hypothetical protein BDZ97DRAFT_1756322 [Flammula alnicola]
MQISFWRNADQNELQPEYSIGMAGIEWPPVKMLSVGVMIFVHSCESETTKVEHSVVKSRTSQYCYPMNDTGFETHVGTGHRPSERKQVPVDPLNGEAEWLAVAAAKKKAHVAAKEKNGISTTKPTKKALAKPRQENKLDNNEDDMDIVMAGPSASENTSDSPPDDDDQSGDDKPEAPAESAEAELSKT